MKLHSADLPFRSRAGLALADRRLGVTLQRAAERFDLQRREGLRSLPDPDAARDRARAARLRALRSLDEHLARFEAAASAAGARVHWAGDAAEAAALVVGLARERGVRRVVKAKSMLSQEIGLNSALEAAGVEVTESDLGAYVVQLAREAPSHILAPALHKTREEIGKLFHDKLGIPLTHDPGRIAAAARARLREAYLGAQMGVSGVNFGVAETGSIAIVSNEGNASLSTSAPPLHVALMGLERVVPTLADLEAVLAVLARSATGQKLGVYTDLLTGPRRAGAAAEPDGPAELHVVLVDNGRSRVLGSPLAEILLCIRCAACLTACPVYAQIGGHAYGSVYSGPLGAVLTPALGGLAEWRELPWASTLCGACREVCPVRIDLPRLLVQLRQEGQLRGATPLVMRAALRVYRFAAVHPRLFRAGIAAVRAVGGAVAAGGWFRHLPPPLRGWTTHRDFPAFAPEPFSVRLRKLREKPR